MKKFYLVLFCIIFSCSTQKEKSISILRIGILPDENKKVLLFKYTPLFKYLSKEIGIPYKIIFPTSYAKLLDLFHKGKIDLAHFGGMTFVKANTLYHAIPLVMRDVDNRFTSYFLVKKDNPSTKLADFKGKTISFGSKLSTSGHLMPRFFLTEKEMIPESFFGTVRHSGAHDKTVYWVRDGVVDLGVANSIIVDRMYNSGQLNKNEVRILWETPPYPDYVWAMRPVFSKSIQIKIIDAFLSLSLENKDHAIILARLGAKSYQPAGAHHFTQLKQILKNLNLLDQDK